MALNAWYWKMVGFWSVIFQQPQYETQTWIWKKTGGPLLLAGSLGGLILAMAIARSKRNKRENDEISSMHSSQSDDAPDDAEVATPKRKSKRALKKEDGESCGDIAITPTKDHYCRFCNMKFDKSQALGGHMNRHRLERENEELQKAKDLVIQREQHYGGALWSMQGAGAGSLHHGGTMLPNPSAVGASSRPYFQASNQPASTLQSWQLNQILATQQTSYTLQSQPQTGGSSHYNSQSEAGGSYYGSQDSARPHQGHTGGVQQQLRVNPGQQMTGHVIQSGADIAGLQSSFHLNQPGPSPLEEVVLGSTNLQVQSTNNAMASFIQRSSQSNIQFVDVYGNIPPSTSHFQPGQGQGHSFQDEQHNFTSYDQSKPETSGMSGLEINDANSSGILHMPSFQDSTADQCGSDQNTTAVERSAGDEKLQH